MGIIGLLIQVELSASITLYQMYQIYRTTSLGTALIDTLEELAMEGKTNPVITEKVLQIFDEQINAALCQKSKTKMNFTGLIRTYNYCDYVWTFLVDGIQFSEMQNHLGCQRLKIVSMDAKSTG